MTKLTYPDGSAVNYTYDANRNLLTVTDWANRVTSYTYDENNRVIGVTKPDGSVTTTVYDNMQRVTSTVERTADGAVITGFEYTYDDLSRITEEKVLANSTKFCYTYDDLGRVTERRKETLGGVLISSEVFSHDAAGNVSSACGSCVQYDTNNRLTVFDGNPVYYDRDGNMLDNGVCCFDYDSANRLVRVCDHEYTYNAEDVRIRKLCDTEDTIYTYNTNAKLSQLLTKTTCCTETKYVYGIGLIGEEENGAFKTYHFDYRGSTVAVTNECGNITDTFAYDTYGKLIGRTGTSDIIFKYNGRDGVITDGNGLIYMRARYYSPDMRRFVNADIVAGSISNAVTLNRFAYANGNPVSFVDPFGLSVWSWIKDKYNDIKNWVVETYNDVKDFVADTVDDISDFVEDVKNFDINNEDEQKVLDSNCFSSYKGKFVVRAGGLQDRSFSLGILFIDHAEDDKPDKIQTVQHEYGHTKQLDELGLTNYLLYVAIPSIFMWGPEAYYHKPWEIIADINGGVDIYNRPYYSDPSQENINNGYEYMKVIGNDDYSILFKYSYILYLRHLDDSNVSSGSTATNTKK